MKVSHTLSVYLFAILLSLFTGAVLASAKQSLSKQTFRQLQQAQEWLESGEDEKAIDQLQAMVGERADKPYEQAVVLQSLGYAEVAREQFSAAIPSLKRSLGMNVLPAEVQQELRYNLAQLYMATEAFAEAISQLHSWMALAQSQKAEAYVMLGSAYFQLKQYKQSVTPFQKAIQFSDRPKESWYQGLLAVYTELKDYPASVALLHTMVRKFPNRSVYWQQLAGMELTRERYPQALALMEMAYREGHLDSERQLLNLAQLYLLMGAPYKSGSLLEVEFKRGRIKKNGKNLGLAANAWHQAKEHERAIDALERAAGVGVNAAIELRLSQMYMTVHRWADAEKRLVELLSINGVEGQLGGKAWVLLGVVRFEQDKLEGARDAFTSAKGFGKKSAEEAVQWLAYLRKEQS